MMITLNDQNGKPHVLPVDGLDAAPDFHCAGGLSVFVEVQGECNKRLVAWGDLTRTQKRLYASYAAEHYELMAEKYCIITKDGELLKTGTEYDKNKSAVQAWRDFLREVLKG